MKFEDAFPEHAGGGIRTHELLREWALNPSPLTWLGNPRLWVYRLLESFVNKSMAADAELSRRLVLMVSFAGFYIR